MQITVSGKQVDLSDALRTRVTDHLDAISSKYFDHALEAHVTFSRARQAAAPLSPAHE
jgi:ribosome-associated translation inhibitor RaiA